MLDRILTELRRILSRLRQRAALPRGAGLPLPHAVPLSAAGLLAAAAAFIGPWEGRELRAYRDLAGVWTICYGATADVRPGQTATPAECDSRLALDVARHHAGLRACLPGALPRSVELALTSWTFNVGIGAACGSTLIRLAQNGDFASACQQLLRWRYAGGRVVPGLERRREAERQLCLTDLRPEEKL